MASNSNYVAAWTNWDTGLIEVIERDLETGERFVTRHQPPYYFYVPHPDGEYTSIFDDKVTKLTFGSRDEFEAAKQKYVQRFESDISPLARLLMDEYYGRPAPPVTFAFLDIEVDYAKKIGFAGPTNPYAPINAITIYQSWSKQYITLAVPPPEFETRGDEFQALILAAWEEHQLGFKPNVFLMRDELELLETMCALIEEADIISGWNSEFFDIPYICERMILVFGQNGHAGLDYASCRKPEKKMVNRFGTEEPVYKLFGRTHLDYLELFKKFTFEGRTSYALANIADEELDIPKLEYEGTLEELYHNDFIHFIAYNARDVEVLVKLDEKYKFIALTNQMAHENTVDFSAVLGTVKYVETGITTHAHNVLKRVVHDKRIGDHDRVEGAIVLTPRPALYEWVFSCDINSLYPNVIRTLNISPEKIIGQFVQKEEAWNCITNNSDDMLCLIFNDNSSTELSAGQWRKILADNKWAVSAYGTIFDQSTGVGVVPDIVKFWYSERKRLQKEKKKWQKELARLEKLTLE